jgi:hypothetical protein
MKGTVLRPNWPAPAAKAATHSKSAERQEERSGDSRNRITLALLEEHGRSPEDAKGYDPYNALPARRPVDAWRRKPKRD